MKFKTILIDPPWPERGAGRIKRGADRHYRLLRLEEIPGVIAGSGVFAPAKDSHLYLWATNKYLRHAIDLMGKLGFRYVTMVTWAKDRSGLGQYFRGQTEHMIFGVRGEGLALRRRWTRRRDLTTLILAPHPVDERRRRIHSAKPHEAFELIEAASPPPRLEMFARSRRSGWHAWGDGLKEPEKRMCAR